MFQWMSQVIPMVIMSNYILLKQLNFRLLKTVTLDVLMLLYVVSVHPVERVEVCIAEEIAWDLLWGITSPLLNTSAASFLCSKAARMKKAGPITPCSAEVMNARRCIFAVHYAWRHAQENFTLPSVPLYSAALLTCDLWVCRFNRVIWRNRSFFSHLHEIWLGRLCKAYMTPSLQTFPGTQRTIM